MKEIINKINQELTQTEEDKQESIEKGEIKEIKYEGKIGFVDGGNLELIKTTEWAVELMKIGWVILKGSKLVDSGKKEFIAWVKNEKTIIGEKEFKNVDEARQALELRKAVKLSGQVGMVVLDGCLEIKGGLEEEKKKLLKSSAENHCLICALSKTSQLKTGMMQDGEREKGEWWKKIRKREDFENYLVRLHKLAEYCFRLDVLAGISVEERKRIFSVLADQSKDPLFLGYPYGLIAAHKIAKVSVEDEQRIKQEIKQKIGEKWLELEKETKKVNMHDELDKIT